MHLKYKLFRRRNGVFYWRSNDPRKQGTLRTADRREAECLLNAMNESHRVPIINLNLARAILANRAWPKIYRHGKRAVTAEEHRAIVASEKNPERRAYYELLYETGASQTDAANLTTENIDWPNRVLTYRRQKLGPTSE